MAAGSDLGFGSKLILSWRTSQASPRGIFAKDFVEYFKDGPGRYAKESGLFVCNEDR
jgi:hypothetical protein